MGSSPTFGTKRLQIFFGAFLILYICNRFAEMAELVDAHVSGACVLTGVGVRLPLSALSLVVFSNYQAFFLLPSLLARRLRLACTILAGFARFWGLPAKASDHGRFFSRIRLFLAFVGKDSLVCP